MALLAQQHFLRRIYAPKVGTLLLGQSHLCPPKEQPVPLAQLLCNEVKFSLRAACQFVGGTDTLPPAPANPGIPDGHIKGIVAHRNNGAFHFFVAHFITPVNQVVHACPFPRLHQRPPSGSRRNRGSAEALIVRNTLVMPFPIPSAALLVSLTRRHPQSWMGYGLIFFVRPLSDPLGQCW